MAEYTNERMRRDLRGFKNRLKRRFKVEKMILFGSRARNEHLLDSDVDLIIVSRQFQGQFFTNRISDVLEYWSAPVDLEPLCYTPEEFKRKLKEYGIVRTAVKEGVEI